MSTEFSDLSDDNLYEISNHLFGVDRYNYHLVNKQTFKNTKYHPSYEDAVLYRIFLLCDQEIKRNFPKELYKIDIRLDESYGYTNIRVDDLFTALEEGFIIIGYINIGKHPYYFVGKSVSGSDIFQCRFNLWKTTTWINGMTDEE